MAKAYGYRVTGTYLMTESGGIGIPFVNPEVTELNADQPRRLFYHLNWDGTYELLGAGYQVAAPKARTTPRIFNQLMSGPVNAYLPEEGTEYRLNAWLFRDNPIGLFAEAHAEVRKPVWWSTFEIARTRADTLASYDDAVDAGYEYNGECVLESRLGGMGLVLVHPEERYLDADHPNALLFVENGGKLQLMALRWRVPAREITDFRTLFGHMWAGPFTTNDDDPQRYWDDFLWPCHDHPDGVFTPFTSLRCEREI